MAGTIPLLYQNPATGISAPASFTGEFAKTANYTVLPTDNGALFTNANANAGVNFTLPSITNAGYQFGFMAKANQQLTVTSAEGNNIVWFNTIVANSLSFNTANGIVGGFLVVFTGAAGATWHVLNMSSKPNAASGNVITQA